MKSIETIIAERLRPQQRESGIDTSVKTAERKKVYNAIYNELDQTGVTGKLYRDDDWGGVKIVTKVCNDALAVLNSKMKNEYHYEISIAPDNGGYRKSDDGMSQWKQYKVEIFKVTRVYDNYPAPFIVGTLNCHAAGSMKDPFNAYDMSFCISY